MCVCEAHTHSYTSLDITECIRESLNGLDIAMACLWVLGSQCHGLLGHASCHCKVTTARQHRMAYKQLDRQPVIFSFHKKLGQSLSICRVLETFAIWQNNLSSVSAHSLVSELSTTSHGLQQVKFYDFSDVNPWFCAYPMFLCLWKCYSYLFCSKVLQQKSNWSSIWESVTKSCFQKCNV